MLCPICKKPKPCEDMVHYVFELLWADEDWERKQWVEEFLRWNTGLDQDWSLCSPTYDMPPNCYDEEIKDVKDCKHKRVVHDTETELKGGMFVYCLDCGKVLVNE